MFVAAKCSMRLNASINMWSSIASSREQATRSGAFLGKPIPPSQIPAHQIEYERRQHENLRDRLFAARLAAEIFLLASVHSHAVKGCECITDMFKLRGETSAVLP